MENIATERTKPIKSSAELTEYESFLLSLGRALSQVRSDHGFTQIQLASRARRKQPAIAKIENGPVPNLALRVIYEISNAIPVPLSVLFQMAEAQMVSSSEKVSSNNAWVTAMEEVKKLPPSGQKWIGQIVLNILESSKAIDN